MRLNLPDSGLKIVILDTKKLKNCLCLLTDGIEPGSKKQTLDPDSGPMTWNLVSPHKNSKLYHRTNYHLSLSIYSSFKIPTLFFLLIFHYSRLFKFQTLFFFNVFFGAYMPYLLIHVWNHVKCRAKVQTKSTLTGFPTHI